jgi:DNA-binding FrmR family transcriptional regulator
MCLQIMPHSKEDKKKALIRLRRIKGQAEALERAIEVGTDCSLLLQQISALRGAAGGLMAEVLESHLRESFAQNGNAAGLGAHTFEDIDEIVKILRTYLK